MNWRGLEIAGYWLGLCYLSRQISTDLHTVILWQDLNFWTAVGQVAMGIMFGVIAGVVLRRVSWFAQRAPRQARRRDCPACGGFTLQRASGTPVQRAIRAFLGRWPYYCTRCNWPSPPRKARPAPPAAKSPEPIVVTPREPVVVPSPEPVKAEVIETKAVHARAARAAVQAIEAEPEPPPPPPVIKDDTTLVKDSVFQYVAMLNTGDVSARASCYLSEFTTFAIDGGPLISKRFEGRTGPIQTFDLRCRDLRVYIHKDTAIATGYLIGTITDANNQPLRVTGRCSWVHLRQGGEWKIAHSTSRRSTPRCDPYVVTRT